MTEGSAKRFLKEVEKTFPSINFSTHLEKIHPYKKDEAYTSTVAPIAVFFPNTTEEVSQLLTLASKHSVAVIPRGAGSGLSGAVVPIDECAVISLEKMDRIIEINEADQVAVVEPGVITGQIRDEAMKKGLFYPPIPASVDFCTIGGNVATNAGGLCAVKYGVTREYIIGLEAVLPNGDVIQCGGRYLKNTTGYNLTQLICGSEGTLAMITKIILRLLPYPAHRKTLLIGFDDLHSAANTVLKILKSNIRPPTLELLPDGAVQCVLEKHTDLSFPFSKCRASLLIELDGPTEKAVDESLGELGDLLEKETKHEPLVAATDSQRDELWNIRKLVRESISTSGDYVEADSVVPRQNVPALVQAAEEVSNQLGIRTIAYGHAGDGNLHTYFLRGNESQKVWEEVSENVLKSFFKKTIALNGTISGEHGIGYLKRDYLPMAFKNTEIALMKQIKKAFDPKGLMNPGKVFPDKS